MGNKAILVKNTFWLGLVETVSKLIMFVVTITIVRYLGPSEFGTYNLAFSYVALFMILSDFGLGIVCNREISKHKDQSQKYLSNLLGIKLALTVIITFLLAVFLFLVPTREARNLIWAVLFYNLAQNLTNVFIVIFSAWEKMELVFASRLAYFGGMLISVLGAVHFKGNSLQIVWTYGLTTFLASIFSAYLLSKLHLKIAVSFDFIFWKGLLKETVPFMGLAVVGIVFGNTDTLLIGKYFGNEQVGLYQSAYKILFAFQSINVVNNAIFPRINVLLHENKTETLHKLIKTLTVLSLAGMIPLAVVITIFRNQIITTIYGQAYSVAADTMAIMIWSGVVNYFRIMTSNILFAKNNQKRVFYAVLTGLIVNLLINIFFLPKFDITVSAWGLLLSEIVIFVLLL